MKPYEHLPRHLKSGASRWGRRAGLTFRRPNAPSCGIHAALIQYSFINLGRGGLTAGCVPWLFHMEHAPAPAPKGRRGAPFVPSGVCLDALAPDTGHAEAVTPPAASWTQGRNHPLRDRIDRPVVGPITRLWAWIGPTGRLSARQCGYGSDHGRMGPSGRGGRHSASAAEGVTDRDL
jgi:hypothetical protein